MYIFNKKSKKISFCLILKYLFDDHPLKQKTNKKTPPFNPRDRLKHT